MSTHPQKESIPLPQPPNLRHLRDQARDLHKVGAAKSLTDAQLQIARRYGFPSWPKLKAHVESLNETGQLKLAIDANDLQRVMALMTKNPDLHRAPLGYGEDGPLTWVAECRVPWEPPSPTRLAMADWMVTHGSDVHQGGDGPLMRAALSSYRIPMMELLVSCGADVNALWHGNFPIVFAPCESMDAEALKWLLDHGANPNCRDHNYEISGHAYPGTALDYLIAGYARSLPQLASCIDVLLAAGGETRFGEPAVLAILRDRLDLLADRLAAEPELARRRYRELDCGQTGGRSLLLKGTTLLHVAVEYGNLDAAALLLDRGVDVNAKADVDSTGVGGQTAIFHSATQYGDYGLQVSKLLVDRGADLSVRVKLPGDYERVGEVVECTPLGYALRFGDSNATIQLLRERGGLE